MKVWKKRQPLDSLSSDGKFKVKHCIVNVVRCDKLIARLTKADPKRPAKTAKITTSPTGRHSNMSRPSSTASRPSSTIGRPPSTIGRPPSTTGRPPSTTGRPPSTIGRPPSTMGRPPSTAGRPSSSNTTNRPSSSADHSPAISRPLKLITLQSGSTGNRILTKVRPGSSVTANRVIVKLKPGQNLQKLTMPMVAMASTATSNERTRRTPKPNPKYINDSMETKWATTEPTPSNSEISDTESDADNDDGDNISPIARTSRHVKTDPIKRVNRVADDGPSLAELKAVTMKMSKTPMAKTMMAKTPVVSSNKMQPLNKRKITFDDENKKPPLKKEKIRRDSDISLIYTSDDDYNSFEDSEDSDNSEPDVRPIPPKHRQQMTTTAAASIQRNASTTNNKLTTAPKPAPTIVVKRTTPIAQRQFVKQSSSQPIAAAKATVTPQPKFMPKQTSSPTVAYRFQQPVKKAATPTQPKPTVAAAAASSKSQPITRKPVDFNDLEDFERMPTFTIVNINDIINKKDEVVVIEKGGKRTIKGGQTTIVEAGNADDDDEEEEETQMASTNRRKTQHKVLSEKIDKSKKATPTLMRLPPAPSPLIADKSTKPYRNIIGVKNGNYNKNTAATAVDIDTSPTRRAPPRILNSALCKNSITDDLSPVVSTNLPTRKASEPRRFYHNNHNNSNVSPPNTTTVLNRSKENQQVVTAAAAGDNTMSPPSTTTTAKNVVAQSHPTNRRVRKITCYETWFVIKFLDDNPELPIKTSIDFSLIRLGNDIKDIGLPSGQWSYKISLQKKKLMADTEKNAFDANEIYTGEVQDESIKVEQRHLYCPTNIMFRRRCINQLSRMQFDRAVIFKNRTFFINIEGKNVRLLGAPHEIEYFGDIEMLLKIVDDISLGSSCVEQTNLCL